ncbi:MAG: putative porin, partial [Pseudomonadota bacterium]
YERYQYSGWKDFRPFIHLGQMMLHEVDTETDDPALYINQVGFEWTIDKVTWTLAGSYYDWANLHNTRYLHLAQYRRGGGNSFTRDNTGALQYLYDYNLWEAISFIAFDLGPIPTTLIFDYIVNCANNIPSDQDTAFFVGFQLGKEKKKGDYSFFYKYARIEKDAVIGSMNDQDFYGANRKGHKIKFAYMLLDRLSLETAFFYTDPITAWNPRSVNWNNEQNWEHENRFQVDFIFRF